jgi:outer membrane receptor for ferrienterochelin and colicins
MSNKVISSLRTVKKLYIYPLLLCAATFTVNAQQVSENIEAQIGKIYVYGEDDSQSGLIDSAVKTEALSSSEMEEAHHNSLSDAITEIPGVSQVNVDRRSSAKTALIQGFGENSVLVMIDGTPVSQNSAFGFDLSQISTENIEKIEVIKGGASALYGSQAIGGVINIKTKKPNNREQYLIDISSGLATSAQDARTNNIKALYSGRSNKIGHKFTFSIRNQENFDLDPQTIAKDGAEVKNLNGSLYLDRRFGKNTIALNYIYLKGEVSSENSKPFGSSVFGKILNETKTDTHNIKLSLLNKKSIDTLKASVSFERINDDLNLNDNPLTYFKEMDKRTQYDAYRAELSYDTVIGDIHAITAGLLYKQDLVNQNTRSQQTEEVIIDHKDIDNKRVQSIEAFVQDNIVLDTFEISPGIRIQEDSATDFTVAPKLSLSYYKELASNIESKTWFTIGTGHRSPSIKERYFTLDHSSVGNYIVQGKENLLAEKSVSLQLGDEITFGKKASIHANLFYNQIKNLIETTEIESQTSTRIFSYENINEVTSRGLELSSTLNLNSANSFKVNYTYTETKDEKTKLHLVNRPFYIWKAKYRFSPTQKIKLITSLNYIGKKYLDTENTEVLPDYITTDLKLNYAFKKNMDIYFGIKNIFNSVKDPAQDTVIPVVDDRPAMGRFIYTGLRIKTL